MEIKKLGFIGAGQMGTAILDGVVKSGLFRPEDIFVSNPHEGKLAFAKGLGAHTSCDNLDVVKNAELIILAVKPQKFPELMAELEGRCTGKAIVSIAAGISTEKLGRALPDSHIVRVMPNTPLKLGKGAIAIAEAKSVPEEVFKAVYGIFSAVGVVEVMPEELIDAVSALSGSSPAFFFRMADIMVDWAAKQGIEPKAALKLAAATMEGSARLLLASEKSPKELEREVCSPGGSTLEGLSAFDEFDFDRLLREALARCTRKNHELGG